jgi:hypothetical protein
MARIEIKITFLSGSADSMRGNPLAARQMKYGTMATS